MNSKKTPVRIKAFDLFCGVGGLTYGLRKAGVPVMGGLDVDKHCQYPYEKNCNAKFVQGDIRDIKYKDLRPFFGDADYRVLVGCAPCQPFSSYVRKFKENKKSEKWNMINEFLRIIKEGKPEIISMENVPGLSSREIFFHFIEELKKEGYAINYRTVTCTDFGVPQSRRRLVLLGSLNGQIQFIQKKRNKVKTIRQAIGRLEKIKHGETSCTDRFHVSSALAPINIDRIKASKPGGSWKDWPKRLLPDCYKKPSGQDYGSVYGRMEWDKPGPTLTTQFLRYGTGRYGHPEQNRALSLREGAILQTFPRSYEFCAPDEPINLARIGRHIGNAVPPSLAYVIGKSILKHVESKGE